MGPLLRAFGPFLFKLFFVGEQGIEVVRSIRVAATACPEPDFGPSVRVRIAYVHPKGDEIVLRRGCFFSHEELLLRSQFPYGLDVILNGIYIVRFGSISQDATVGWADAKALLAANTD